MTPDDTKTGHRRILPDIEPLAVPLDRLGIVPILEATGDAFPAEVLAGA